LLVAHNNICYSKNVFVSCTRLVIWLLYEKIALENDFIKSKHVALRTKVFFISGGDGKILNVLIWTHPRMPQYRLYNKFKT
jgi:hypothetical protein